MSYWVAGAAIVGSLGSAYLSSKSSKDAASAQQEGSEAGVEEQRRQFDQLQEMLKPFIKAGYSATEQLQEYAAPGKNAFEQQQALLGLRGQDEYQNAIASIENGPQMQALTQQGENALLQNAAATGGLRGGNLQAALAQFRPKMLSELLDQQYSKLGGITALGQQTQAGLFSGGQASAAMQADAGQNMANAVTGLYGDIGTANASKEIAQGQFLASIPNTLLSALGTIKGGQTGTNQTTGRYL